jgi:hypothetical protein
MDEAHWPGRGMARMVNKLSALKAVHLNVPGCYSDGGGLWLQVTPGGSKSWVYRYAINGRRFHMGLGPLREVPLARARELAKECTRRVRAGGHPLAERQEAKAVARLVQSRQMTFDACAHAYIAAHRASWRNA